MPQYRRRTIPTDAQGTYYAAGTPLRLRRVDGWSYVDAPDRSDIRRALLRAGFARFDGEPEAADPTGFNAAIAIGMRADDLAALISSGAYSPSELAAIAEAEGARPRPRKTVLAAVERALEA